MIIKNVDLETVCGIDSPLPENDKPEIAFVGRSNVGKSSLINALMNRKSLARTSSQPGKTRTINFYNINDLIYLVDLPGYGYANVSKREQEKWGKMIEKYLVTSKQLMGIFVLIDIRHEPTENDVIMYNWIEHFNYHPVIIATKLDKIKRSQRQKNLKVIREKLGMPSDALIFPFSAQTKEGRDEIWEYIDNLYEVYSSNNVDIR